MEFLKAFANHNEYLVFTNTGKFVRPNVSLCQQENEMHYKGKLKPNGHAYVDLGLPSGTLWATMDIGANSENENGIYFRWGETVSRVGMNRHKFHSAQKKLTKYCIESEYGENGFVDNITTLELMDDAANVIWGGDWHIPSDEQFQELMDNTYQNWNRSSSSMTVTSIHNGNTLLFKAGGYRSGSYDSLYKKDCAYYWLNSLGGETQYSHIGVSSPYGHNFEFSNNANSIYNEDRTEGLLIRGVLG